MKMVVADALEDCLERLEAGASLEQVLVLYPQWAEEMRPLLESALLAWSLRVTTPVPEASMARSRALFIQKTAVQPRRRGLFNFRLRFSHSFIAALSTAAILTIGTTFVSAQSLPGDILYPVKLAGEQTRLILTTNTDQRLILQEGYDQTRAVEVENVLQDHRLVQVTFVGLLTRTLDNHWQVAGVNILFPPNLEPAFEQMLNAYVEVDGLSQEDGIVQVSQVHLRELTFSGKLTDMTPTMWYVDRIEVGIEKATKITGLASVGAHVWVDAYRQEDGTLYALQLIVIDPGKQEVLQPTATSQSSENQDSSAGNGNNATATSDDSNVVAGGTANATNTAIPQPAWTSTPASAGTGDQKLTQNSPTASPSNTLPPTATATTVAKTRTRTPAPTLTATPTATQSREGGTRPPENGNQLPSPTPTPTDQSSDQGG